MTSNVVTYNIFNLHTHESTLDEESSFIYLQTFFPRKQLNYFYNYPKLDLDTVHLLASRFCLIHANIKDSTTGNTLPMNTPLHVFRYLMLEDGSWSNYYTLKKKNGYVVEGMYWSNGMVYQVREDKDKDFELYEVTLSIDALTKTVYNCCVEFYFKLLFWRNACS